MAGGQTRRSARLSPLERTFLEVLRRRDPSRHWQPAPGHKQGTQVRERPTGTRS